MARDSWGKEEIDAINRVIKSNRFSMGQEVARFESAVCDYFGSRYSVMVNSGSSANLVMLTAAKILRNHKWPDAPEIIVPAVSWSTTFTPLYYLGIRPVFVDINPKTLCIDPESVKRVISDKTVAIFAVNILGQPSELEVLSQMAAEYDLDLLEDNCESLGATLHGKFTGTFGLASSHSSFYSHHISTMEGGWIQTDNKEFSDICKSLRAHGWIREIDQHSKFAISTGSEFQDKFHFVLPGLNFRPLEFEGAIGIEQLKKLSEMLRMRKENAALFVSLFSNLEYLRIQEGIGQSSWFAFSIVLTGYLKGKRSLLVDELTTNGIECRPIIAGNFTKQPVMKFLDADVPFELRESNSIHEDGFYVGNHPHELSLQLLKMKKIIENFANNVR